MSKYKGLFTFDEDNHRYVHIAQADGVIDTMGHETAEPLIEDKEIREIVRPWAKVNGATELKYYEGENCLEDMFRNEIHFNQALGLEDAKTYTTEELCGAPEPIEPMFIDLDGRIKGKEKKLRPVIADGVEYDSYADYLKSREEEG